MARGMRHSQSMIRKNRSGCNLPGINEQTVKLQTLRPTGRPIILSNIEHVGEFHMLHCSLVPTVGLLYYSTLFIKVYMTQNFFSAYLKGLSKYRRMAFFFLKYLFLF